jgi:hypothetical protein
MTQNRTEVKFHGAQEDFFRCGPQPHIFFAGVGAGKTWIACLKMLYLLEQYPGSRGVIIRNKGNALRKTTLATFKKLLPRERIHSQNLNEGVIKLTNGSEVLLMHLGNTDSLDNLKSLEINFAYIDQMEEIRDATAWDTVLERVGRWTGATRLGGYPLDWPHKTEVGEFIPPTYVFASCYSPGYDHWITARFWEQGDERNRYRKEGYVTFIGSTLENPNLTTKYKQERMNRGQEYVDRYVRAISWGANEGAIFNIDSQSLVPYDGGFIDRIRRRMRLHRVLDPADFDTTACLWYATDEHGNVFFYREYGRENLLVSQHRQNIFDLSKEDAINVQPSYYSNIADPVISNKTRGRTHDKPPQWSIQDEYSDTRVQNPETAIFWRKSNNDESMTISRLREYLRVDPNHRNPFTGELGAPRVYFIVKSPEWPHGLKETITDIRSARRIEIGQNSDGTKKFGDKRDEDVRDHYLDCVRYAIGMRPSLAQLKEEEPEEPGTIRWSNYEKRMEDQYYEEMDNRLKNFEGHSPYGDGY